MVEVAVFVVVVVLEKIKKSNASSISSPFGIEIVYSESRHELETFSL